MVPRAISTQLPYNRIAFGGGAGAVGGTGVGAVITEASDTLKQAAGLGMSMGASIGFTVGCAMIGFALGALMGGRIVGEINFNPTKGQFAIKAVPPTG